MGKPLTTHRSPLIALCSLFLLLCPHLSAQSYRCDWQVVATAGGELVGNYRCGVTLGQTASGHMAGGLYQAFIGFWQTETQVGIKDEPAWPNAVPLVTRLYAPVPNPFRSHLAIRYTLDAERPTLIEVHDLTGRVVRRLVNSRQKPGRYTLSWNGTDMLGRRVANGVYFCRMVAGDYRATRKVVLER